ncbi:tetratricopeptide repeat protein [Salidesulfovibrio brasiliensis]|uniref:tetratricopeptide repeat protein n=1 Tax=Salidesulfovibrio brasiliensis TaxID=221711 RepID=UPI0006CFCF3C|nr:tetratricopeptide repeat protein [Salidesulfovibrio brasiliensis]
MKLTHALRPCLLALLLLAAACAPMTAPVATGDPAAATPRGNEAQITYNYLLYQDYLSRMNRLGPASDADREKALRSLRDKAADTLRKVIDASPEPQLYLELASLYWNDGNSGARARDILNEGLERYPENSLLTIYLANSWIQEGKAEKGLGLLERYVAAHPGEYEVRIKLAQAYLDTRKPAEALDQLNKLSKESRTPEVLFLFAAAESRLGQTQKAIGHLKNALKEDPQYFEALAELAYLYETVGDYTEAEKTYRRILEMGDVRNEVRLRVILLNLKLNNVDEAMRLALDGPGSKAFLLDAASLFLNEGFQAQASTVLDALASGGNPPGEYWFYKAVIAWEGENDAAKAAEYLATIGKDHPFYSRALEFRGRLLHSIDRSDEALQLTREGRELFPDKNEFYLLEAAILVDTDRMEGALEVLEEGLEHRPEDPELMYEKGALLENMGRRDDALDFMETMLAAHPDNSDALNFVGYTLAEEGRDLERALVLVTAAYRLDPQNAFIADSVAWVQYKLGNFDKAWKYIREAVSQMAEEPILWEHYGDIARALGKTAEARKGYGNALKYHHNDPDAINAKLKGLQ